MSLLSSSLDRCAIAEDLRQDVRLAEDQDLVGAELDLGAAVLAEDDLVALVEVERDVLAVVVTGARADGQDAAALRLLLRRVRQDDPARRRLLFLENLDDQAVTKRLQIHGISLDSFVSVCDLCCVFVPSRRPVPLPGGGLPPLLGEVLGSP